MKVNELLVLTVVIGLAAGAASARTVSHWSMNGSGTAVIGDAVLDVVGNNDGVVVGAPGETLEYVAGPLSSPGALRFSNSSSSKVNVPDDSSLHFDLDGDDFTMETIFRVTGSATRSPFGKNGTSSSDSQYWMRVQPDGSVVFLVRGDGGDGPGGTVPQEYFTHLPSVNVDDGKWHHFAAVYTDGGDVELFVDYANVGAIDVDPLVDRVIGFNSGPLVLGGFNNTGGRNFDGDIADVRISNMPLSTSEFLAIPEPTSLALALFAMIGLAATRKNYC